MARIKYARGSQEETVAAAAKLTDADGKTRYVFGTYYGATIDTRKPVCQSYVEVTPGAQCFVQYAPWGVA